jgi:Arc/MetJ family transcription regulator
MRTNIVLDDRLVAEAMRATGARSKREVVDMALRELLAKHRARRVIALRGQALIDPRYDVRAIRRAMRRDAR